MAIDPIKSNAVGMDKARLNQANATPAKTNGETARPDGTAARDTAEVSAASQRLVEGAHESTEHGLSADRLKEILGRLESGHYDRIDVRDAIARRLLNDMTQE